jgi:hypothetical protein
MSDPRLAAGRLAKLLYETLVRFDPDGSEPWESLREDERALYEDVIETILSSQTLVLEALKEVCTR